MKGSACVGTPFYFIPYSHTLCYIISSQHLHSPRSCCIFSDSKTTFSPREHICPLRWVDMLTRVGMYCHLGDNVVSRGEKVTFEHSKLNYPHI